MGAELELVWNPKFLSGLQVDMAYSYLEATVDGSTSIDPLNRAGDSQLRLDSNGNAISGEFLVLQNIDAGSASGVNYVARASDITQNVVDAGIAGGIPRVRGRNADNDGWLNNVRYDASYDVNGDGTADTVTGVEVPLYLSRNFLRSCADLSSQDGVTLGQTVNGQVHCGGTVAVSDGFAVDLDGNTLPNAPKHTIHLGVAHTWKLG